MKTSERCRSGAMAQTFEWLLEEATEFIADPDEEPIGARARALVTLVHASRQARQLVIDRVEVGTVVAVQINVMSMAGRSDVSVHRSLPNPLALLLIASQRCQRGDRVCIVVQRAGMEPTTRSSSWPFGLEVAERLTRPGPPPAN